MSKTKGKSVKGLKLTRKVEQLLYKIYPSLKNYPKAEKHALCKYIKAEFFEIISNLESANSVPSKRKVYAQEADGKLRSLWAMFRLAREEHYISIGFYRDIDVDLTEIAVMLSAYIKSASK